MTVNELRTLAYSIRGPQDRGLLFTTLTNENYGKAWNLTEVLMLEYRARGLLLDRICGIVKGRSDVSKRINVPIDLRTVTGEPFEIVRVQAVGSAPPNMTDINGYAHHTPDQYEPVVYVCPPEFSVAVCAQGYETFMSSAKWLLEQYGWRCAQAGKERFRYTNRRAKTGDRWQLVEVAFEKMRPKLAPPRLEGDSEPSSTTRGRRGKTRNRYDEAEQEASA